MRRDQLFDSGSDDESGHEEEQEAVRAALSARYSGLFSLDLGLTQAEEDRESALQREGTAQSDEDREQEAPEFEFRLFAAQGASTQRVVLPTAAELEGPGGGGLVRPRPVSYHLRAELGLEELERIRVSALTGHEVVEAARQRAWAFEKPWRVVRILLPARTKLRHGPAASTGSKEEGTADGQPDKRKRPGKQRRIATRKREKATKEKEAEEREKCVTKEERLKEKKKRLNREKKLKRRQKDKDKKAAENLDAAGDEGGSDAEGN